MEYITTETHINFHNNCSKRKLTRVERLGHSVNPSGCWSLPYMPKSLDKIMNSRVPQSVKQCQHSPPKVPTAVPLWSRVQLAVVQEPKSVRGVSTCSLMPTTESPLLALETSTPKAFWEEWNCRFRTSTRGHSGSDGTSL